MGDGGNEQVLYTDEVPKLTRKGDVYLPDKKTSPLAVLDLDLEVRETLSSGQYFKVKKVYSRKEHCFFVIKILCKLKAPDIVKKKYFPREITILKKLCHEHVLGVHEVLITNNKGILLMDYMPNGDLLTYINRQETGHLTEAESRHLFHQIKSAVEYLHSNDVVHRDIKCDNLLLDEHLKLKLCDFGFAKVCNRKLMTEACGSLGYAAPEILEGDPYDGKPADIWSMGVTLYAMLCGRLPYHEDCLDVFLDSIYNPQEKLCFPKTVTRDCRDFVHALLVPRPDDRVKIRDLCMMNWLAHPTALPQPLSEMATPIMTSDLASRSMDDLLPASSQLSLDAALRSCSKPRRQSVSFDTDVEHGFSESQKGADFKKAATMVSDVLKAVAIRHAFGESPMSVHKNLDTAIGHGPHHFAHDTIGLKGPAARRISVQLSQTNLSLNKTHVHHAQHASVVHHPTSTKARRASTVPPSSGPRRASLAPRKVSWREESHTSMSPSRKGSLLMLMADSSRLPGSLRRGSLALHCGKIQAGGSSINLSAVDLTTYTSRLHEKDYEDERHHLHYTQAAKVAKKVDEKRHRASETVRRNSVFTDEMKAMQLPNSLPPEEQELVNSFRSQCETMKHLVA